MTFFTARDLRTDTKNIWDRLANDREVVITNNGRPSALMLSVTGDNLEDVLKSVRQARAMRAIESMRAKAAAAGYMTEEEIEAEIAASRKERREREAQCV